MVKRVCSVSKQDKLILSSRQFKQIEITEATHWRGIRLSMVKCHQIGVLSMFVTNTFHCDYPRLTHDIIGSGINPLPVSRLIAVSPSIITKRTTQLALELVRLSAQKLLRKT